MDRGGKPVRLQASAPASILLPSDPKYLLFLHKHIVMQPSRGEKTPKQQGLSI